MKRKILFLIIIWIIIFIVFLPLVTLILSPLILLILIMYNDSLKIKEINNKDD